MPFQTYLHDKTTLSKARNVKKYKGGFHRDVVQSEKVAAHKYGGFWRANQKERWWEKEMDSSQVESLLRDNTKRQWAMYAKMSQDALPLLKNTRFDDKFKSKAMHFMGDERMTKACIARRDRNYEEVVIPPNNAREYALNVGIPPNSQDEHGVYHVDYDGKYFPFQCFVMGSKLVNVGAIPGMKAEPRYQQRYASLYSQFGESRTHLKELFLNNIVGPLPEIAEKIMVCLDTMDQDDTELVYDDPDVYHAYTSDYTVFVSTSSARQNLTPQHALKIRRRLVIASVNFAQAEPVNIPLAEEIMIEVMLIRGTNTVPNSKDTPYQAQNFCMVLNINLVCEKEMGAGLGSSYAAAVKRTAAAAVKKVGAALGRGGTAKSEAGSLAPSVTWTTTDPVPSERTPSQSSRAPSSAASSIVPAEGWTPGSEWYPRQLGADRTNISTVHFFGQNAFSVSLGDLTPSDKRDFATSHESGMYVAGWLIRQLESAGQGNNPHMFQALEASAGTDKTKYFTRQQKAGDFIKAEKNKYFHTKIWLASPTMVIIAISPLKDNTKTIVMVWTVGMDVESVAANAALSSRSDSTVSLGDVQPLVSGVGAHMPALRANPLAPRLAARFRSSLPMDLELELQSL
jgi:hypothetical protein